MEVGIMLLDKPIEMPWAYATRKGYEKYKGEGPGNYFRYFKTKKEAEISIEWMEKRNRWHGEIEYRPNECWDGGYI